MLYPCEDRRLPNALGPCDQYPELANRPLSPVLGFHLPVRKRGAAPRLLSPRVIDVLPSQHGLEILRFFVGEDIRAHIDM
jgi:hypothetical protein